MAVRIRRGRLHVPPLYVPHQTLLLGERTAAVDPAAQVGRPEAVFHGFRAICNVIGVNMLVESVGVHAIVMEIIITWINWRILL